MQKKKRFVIGNWKMAPETVAEAKEIFLKVKRKAEKLKKVTAVICPPDFYVAILAKLSGKSRLEVGVQDLFWDNSGFHTGQISPNMSYDVGARYAIIGHSEKRALGETDEQVAKKAASAVSSGLTAIVCIGEKERDRDGLYLNSLKEQLLNSLKGVLGGVLRSDLIIAYEPVWEIGKSDFQPMEPAEIRQTVIFIRKVLNDAYNSTVSAAIPIIYGGSVSKETAGKIVSSGEVDGLLIGRKSLDPEVFSEILSSINDLK